MFNLNNSKLRILYQKISSFYSWHEKPGYVKTNVYFCIRKGGNTRLAGSMRYEDFTWRNDFTSAYEDFTWRNDQLVQERLDQALVSICVLDSGRCIRKQKCSTLCCKLEGSNLALLLHTEPSPRRWGKMDLCMIRRVE